MALGRGWEVSPPLLCRGTAHTSVTKSQCSAKGFSWVSTLPPKESSSVPKPYLAPGSPATPPHGELFASDEEKHSNKEMDAAVESSKAQSWISCFLAMRQHHKETSACHRAEPRTPNSLHPLVDKGFPPGNKISRAPRCCGSPFPSLHVGRSANHKDTLPGEGKLQSLGGRNESAGAQFNLKARRSFWDILWTRDDAGANNHITAKP